MVAKSESDVTSLAPSSPSRSPKRTNYYVQSPSRESHDGDKSSTMNATPVYNNSPMESPTHPSYGGRHSRNSSGSRFSGTLRSWSGRKFHRKSAGGGTTRNDKGWPECNVIQEEGSYKDEDKILQRRIQIFIGFLAFILFFTALCLIIWGATKQYMPEFKVKRLLVDDFYIGEGTDSTGVPTNLVTSNLSLVLHVYNSAPTFGIHVSSGPINLMYSEIAISTGRMKKYYQSQKSHHSVSVLLHGEKIPLYGAGSGIALSSDGGQVPLRLDFNVTTRGYVVGKLVKTTHHKIISCKFDVDSAKTKYIKILKNTCTYT